MKGLILVAVAIIVFFIWHMIQRKRTSVQEDAWRDTAREAGLEYDGGGGKYPLIRGSLQGMRVDAKVKVVTRGTGTRSSRNEYTFVQALIPAPLSDMLHVHHRDVLQAMSSALGNNEVKTGMQDVDGKIKIESADPAWAVQLFQDDGFRGALLDFFGAFGSQGSVTGEGAAVQVNGVVADREKLRRLIDAAVRAAAELARAAEALKA